MVYALCLKKQSQLFFRHNFVKFQLTLIIFGTDITKTIELCKVYSFSTLPNLRHCTTVLYKLIILLNNLH